MAEATPEKEQRVITTVSKSVRAPIVVWNGAIARADKDGVKINRVMIELLEGYRRGIYKLPKRVNKTERVYVPSVVSNGISGAGAATPSTGTAQSESLPVT